MKAHRLRRWLAHQQQVKHGRKLSLKSIALAMEWLQDGDIERVERMLL